MTTQQIINEISKYVDDNGGQYSNWYVGITSDPEKRLFTEHGVDQEYGKWIHAPADSNEVARTVEKHFLDLGCDGGAGGGDNTSKTIYAYKKTISTNQ